MTYQNNEFENTQNTFFLLSKISLNMLFSAKKSNRYQEANATLDERTNGYKIRKQSTLSKPEAVLELLNIALNF